MAAQKSTYFLGLMLLLIYPCGVQGQSVFLEYESQPLNEILLDLNDRYQIQISINANLSANCILSVRQNFSSVEEALQFLADQCQLSLLKISHVYTFRNNPQADTPDEKPKPATPSTYIYQGLVIERSTQEPLPYTLIHMNDKDIVADGQGRFSFKSTSISEKIQFRHLGYEICDTTLMPGNPLEIILNPHSEVLEEITIRGTQIISDTRSGEEAGRIKFNDIANNPFPGNSINLIFNNIRLMPGIMAAGEAISNYVIWGSYAGQNQVIFDEITLFSSAGINNEIGRINPFLIKNVEVYKGGYNVPYGDRVGGIIVIDGKLGNLEDRQMAVSLTNQIANAYVNTPLFNKKAALQIALRKSYFQLLNWELSSQPEFIIPNYVYNDLNVKFSAGLGARDKIELSIITSEDEYTRELRRRNVSFEDFLIRSTQIGSSLQYARNWQGGGLSSLTLSQSFYRPRLTSLNTFQDPNNSEEEFLDRYDWENTIQEYTAQFKHSFTFHPNHQLDLSLKFIRNQINLKSLINESFLEDSQDTLEALNRLSFYALDHVHGAKWLDLQWGLKVDVPDGISKAYIQPRINGSIHLNPVWQMNFGWGIYNQFIAKNQISDIFGNQNDVWQTLDGETLPVLASRHHVVGVSYHKPRLEANLEFYYKTTDGISRYSLERIPNPSLIDREPPERGEGQEGAENPEPESQFIPIVVLSEGNSRTYGLDLYIKRRFRRAELWLSYSLGKTEEKFVAPDINFPRVSDTGYQEAAHSQRHELKLAWILNLKSFYISATGVYGSGFPNVTNRQARERQRDPIIPYWRFDLACQYRFHVNRIHLEAGFSLLNIFNYENIRLNQDINININTRINTLGTPFTPTVYINARF